MKFDFFILFCYFSDFEQESGYPKQVGRFLDLSFRGICTDEKGKQHMIDKDLITSKHRQKKFIDFIVYFQYVEAVIRRKDEVNVATSKIVFRIGNVQLYARNRNKLNLIIIPASIGFIIFLIVLTFSLRRMRFVKLFYIFFFECYIF